MQTEMPILELLLDGAPFNPAKGTPEAIVASFVNSSGYLAEPAGPAPYIEVAREMIGESGVPGRDAALEYLDRAAGRLSFAVIGYETD